MKRRPTSVTVIAWILLVTSALSLLGSIMALNNPMAQEMMAKSPIPIPLQYVILYVGLAIEILCGHFHVASSELGTLALHWLERHRIANPPSDFSRQADANSRNPHVCDFRLLLVASGRLSIFYHSANVQNE
jgi:hypothetical protein